MSTRDELNSSDEATAGNLPTELLTKKELALKLKISTRKIELDPKLPKIQWGRNVRYDWREVMAYLKGGTAA
jgi:hypothetical protein